MMHPRTHKCLEHRYYLCSSMHGRHVRVSRYSLFCLFLERNSNRESDTHTFRQADRWMVGGRINRWIQKRTHRQKKRRKKGDRQTNRDRQTDSKRGRQRNGETDRQRNRQRNRNGDRKTERNTERGHSFFHTQSATQDNCCMRVRKRIDQK